MAGLAFMHFTAIGVGGRDLFCVGFGIIRADQLNQIVSSDHELAPER